MHLSPRRISRPALALRLLAVAVAVAIAIGYVQPLRAYLRAQNEVEERRVERRALAARRAELQRRLDRTSTEAFVVEEARRLGLVRPGERLFIVTGVKKWERARVR